MAALAPQVQLCPASALLCQATSGGGSARRCSKKSFGVVINKSDGNSLNSNGEPASRCHQLNTRQWKPRSASRSLRSSQARPVATNCGDNPAPSSTQKSGLVFVRLQGKRNVAFQERPKAKQEGPTLRHAPNVQRPHAQPTSAHGVASGDGNNDRKPGKEAQRRRAAFLSNRMGSSLMESIARLSHYVLYKLGRIRNCSNPLGMLVAYLRGHRRLRSKWMAGVPVEVPGRTTWEMLGELEHAFLIRHHASLCLPLPLNLTYLARSCIVEHRINTRFVVYR